MLLASFLFLWTCIITTGETLRTGEQLLTVKEITEKVLSLILSKLKVNIKNTCLKYTINIQGVPGGMDKTSGECSLC